MAAADSVDPMIDDIITFSSPSSLRQTLSSPRGTHNDANHDYNFSGSIYDESSDVGPSTSDDEYHHPLNELIPSRSISTRQSSVSSFPASVIHHTPIYAQETPRTPSKSPLDFVRTTTPTHRSPHAYSTGFRHPSSVRALQMRDDDTTDSDEEPLQRQHNFRRSRLSCYSSSGSTHSSPMKRTSRSAQSSPQKSSSRSKSHREFPLVLLHCTILPPKPLCPPNSRSQLSESLLEAIIPQPYGSRWKTLQDKVIKNTEVRTRGVLIPHPRDEFDMLEEKLLESLELERPRIRQGHYLGSDGKDSATDSGFESAGSSENAEEVLSEVEDNGQKETCPDCGQHVSTDIDIEHKWVVKVYAANGLMKTGAWSAAWSEMEKVDVEIDVWMPEDVRKEVESRIEAIVGQQAENDQTPTKDKRSKRRKMEEQRRREIYGEATDEQATADTVEPIMKTQDEIDGLVDDKEGVESKDQSLGELSESVSAPRDVSLGGSSTPQLAKAELSELLLNYIRLLAQDRRNIAIILLSILVLLYATANSNASAVAVSPAADLTALQNTSMVELSVSSRTETKVEVVTSTVISTSISTSTSIEVATLTETSTTTTVESVTRASASTLSAAHASGLLPGLEESQPLRIDKNESSSPSIRVSVLDPQAIFAWPTSAPLRDIDRVEERPA